MKACPQPQFDIVAFLIGIKTGFTMTIQDHLIGVIMEDVLQVNGATDRCKAVLLQNYNRGVQEAEQQVKNYVEEGINKDLELLDDMELDDEEKAHAGRLSNNPKGLCEYLRDKLVKKIEDTKDEKRKIKKMMNYLAEFENQGKTLEDYKEFATPEWYDPREFPTRTRLYKMLKKMKKYYPHRTFKEIERKTFDNLYMWRESTRQAKNKLKEMNHFNCRDLPETTDRDRDCYQVGIATKAKVFWNLVRSLWAGHHDSEIKTCLLEIAGEQLIRGVVKMAVNMILSMLVNIFGMMALSIVKVVYFGVLFVKRLYQSITETNVALKSQYMGETIGYGMNIIKSALSMKKKRRFK